MVTSSVVLDGQRMPVILVLCNARRVVRPNESVMVRAVGDAMDLHIQT